MKLEDITHVFCLSCVLMIFCVSSQPSCPSGWFGNKCKYKCRCTNTSCDVSGSCVEPFVCQGGWFGPACQYADLAYNTQNLTEITDGNDTTCIAANAGDTIKIPLGRSYVFTWLRIYVSDQGSNTLRSIDVTFKSNSSSVRCPAWRKHTVDRMTIDMHCDILQPINEMKLSGQAVPHLCSVYVSGGRNVAVKETAWQARHYTLTDGHVSVTLDASRAVDGNTNPDIFNFSCTHTQQSRVWIVTLSRQRNVHKYVIYNRLDKRDRLNGFMLESFDSLNRSLFAYEDKKYDELPVYTIVHAPKHVQMVKVTGSNTNDILTLCEVEIYGDSICDAHHFGRDCEHLCGCANNATCFVSTGGCTGGCAAGVLGDSCLEKCDVGKYGINCSQSCSPNCAPSGQANVSPCNNRNGTCIMGCQSGFTGPMCGDVVVCAFRKYGINCSQLCSPNCAPPGQANVSPCNDTTGTCIRGCQSGFTGPMCGDECTVGQFGINCSQSCSPNCVPIDEENVTSCDFRTGTCLTMCDSGFTGDLCEYECYVGTFGINCSQSCSLHCASTGQENVSTCDIRTGDCIKGCQSGFSGALCSDSTDSSFWSGKSVSMDVILGLLGVLTSIFFLTLCLIRKGRPPQEREGMYLE